MRGVKSWACMALLLLAACARAPVAEQATVVKALNIAMVVDVDQRQPVSPPGYAVPAVAGERIVIGARDNRARVFSLEGNELARIALKAPSESGALALGDNLVVLGDVDGILYGINPQTFSIAWRQQLSSVLLGRPVPAGEDFVLQTVDNRVYRFARDGSKRWSYGGQISGGLSLHQGASPLVMDDAIYAVFSYGDVVKLKPESGDLIWRRQLLLDTSAAVLRELKVPIADPVAAGEALIVAFYQGDMVALARADGRRLWQRPVSLRSAPLVGQQYIYAAGSDGAVLALEAQSGDTVWRRQVTQGELVGPVLWRDHLVVADDLGSVYVLDIKGNIVASRKLSGRIDRAPVVLANGILVRNDMGNMYLLQ